MTHPIPILLGVLAIAMILLASRIPRSRRVSMQVVARTDHGLAFRQRVVGAQSASVVQPAFEGTAFAAFPVVADEDTIALVDEGLDREMVVATVANVGDGAALHAPEPWQPFESMDHVVSPNDVAVSGRGAGNGTMVEHDHDEPAASTSVSEGPTTLDEGCVPTTAEHLRIDSIVHAWEDDGGLPLDVDRSRATSAGPDCVTEPVDAFAVGDPLRDATDMTLPLTTSVEDIFVQDAPPAEAVAELATTGAPTEDDAPAEVADDDRVSAQTVVASAEAIIRDAQPLAPLPSPASPGDGAGEAAAAHDSTREHSMTAILQPPEHGGTPPSQPLDDDDLMHRFAPRPLPALADIVLLPPREPVEPERVMLVSLGALPDTLAGLLDSKLRRYTTYAPPVATDRAATFEWTTSFTDLPLDVDGRRALLAEALDLGVDDDLLVAIFDEDPDLREALLVPATLEQYGPALFVHALPDESLGVRAFDVLIAGGAIPAAQQALAIPDLAAYAATQLMDDVDVASALRALYDDERATAIIDQAGL